MHRHRKKAMSMANTVAFIFGFAFFSDELMNVVNSMFSKWYIVVPCNCVYLYTVPHYKELEVFIKRDQETGFGFRVLGGEGAEQPVSPSYFSNHITWDFYSWPVFMWFISRSTFCLNSKTSDLSNFIRFTLVPSFPRGRQRRKAVWGPETSSLASMASLWRGNLTNKFWIWWLTQHAMEKCCFQCAGRSFTEVSAADWQAWSVINCRKAFIKGQPV